MTDVVLHRVHEHAQARHAVGQAPQAGEEGAYRTHVGMLRHLDAEP
jgi:hypothetical protein